MARALPRAYKKLIGSIVRVPYYVEHAGVLAFEEMQRRRERRAPSTHDETLRIRHISPGDAQKDAAKFVILVVYTEGALPQFTMNFVAAVRRSGFNLVVVANSDLDPDSRQHLLASCCLLIERENLGQDFGGYKDGISIVRARFPEVQRIVLANDSVYYLKEGLDRLLIALDGTEDFIGVTEVFDHHYHVASFLMSFGPRVVHSKAFQDFWKRYVPIGTRRWAIFRGEGALSAELLRAGFQPHILFRAKALQPHLQDRTMSALSEVTLLLPAVGRRLMAQSLREAGLKDQARRLDAMARGSETALLPGDPQPIVEALIAAIESRNQMHLGGLLFRKFLGLPVVKRDVLFRAVHTYDELARALSDVATPLRDEILRDAGRRGTTAEFGFWRRLLSRHSAA